jgi:hypothetical protein
MNSIADSSHYTDDSDIKNHVDILKLYASKCSHLTEMGVRGLNSTRVFLDTKPKKLVSYDWDKPPFEVDRPTLEKVKVDALINGVDFEFIVGDTTKVEIEKTDLLYIDTWHTYEQLLLELLLHSSKSTKYIVAHDTNELVFPGMTCAIEDFLNINEQWQLDYMLIDLPGITVLERISEGETSWGAFTEQDLRQEINAQILLYYRQCAASTGPTSLDWMEYRDNQVEKFANADRWPRTNSLKQ